MYNNILKPFLDFLISGVALLLLLPVFFLLSILIFLSTGTNPFFLQQRPGKNEKIFTIIKFKTMNNKRDAQGNLLSDSERLTRLGNFIRKTSLDEIPQLINVFKNDMSFIGPRPLLPEYLSLYDDFQKQRHLVKPGITGWAQVNGRNNISWSEKFKLDVYYVHNRCFILDFKIWVQNVKKVFLKKDINTENEATTHRFKGNNIV